MNPYLIAAIIAITSATTWQICEWKHDAEKTEEVVERLDANKIQVAISDKIVKKTIIKQKELKPKLDKIHEKIIRIKVTSCELDSHTSRLLHRATREGLPESTSLSSSANARNSAVSCAKFAEWAIKVIKQYKEAKALDQGFIEWDREQFE